MKFKDLIDGEVVTRYSRVLINCGESLNIIFNGILKDMSMDKYMNIMNDEIHSISVIVRNEESRDDPMFVTPVGYLNIVLEDKF